MAQFGCACGNRIGLNVVPSRYDAWVLGDEGGDAAAHERERLNATFLAAVRQGQRSEWIHAFYHEPSPPLSDLEDVEVFEDIQSRVELPFMRGMRQCERCGRVWIQVRPDVNHYVSFRPETDVWRGILENNPERFIGYVGGADIHDAVVREIAREGDDATVILRRRNGRSLSALFRGVVSVKEWIPESESDRRLRFLGEWRAEPPLRRYLFDSASQSRQPLLEIVAREMEWRLRRRKALSAG